MSACRLTQDTFFFSWKFQNITMKIPKYFDPHWGTPFYMYIIYIKNNRNQLLFQNSISYRSYLFVIPWNIRMYYYRHTIAYWTSPNLLDSWIIWWWDLHFILRILYYKYSILAGSTILLVYNIHLHYKYR